MLFYNLNGELIKKETIKSNNHSIDISSLNKGIYFVSNEEKRDSHISKLIVD